MAKKGGKKKQAIISSDINPEKVTKRIAPKLNNGAINFCFQWFDSTRRWATDKGHECPCSFDVLEQIKNIENMTWRLLQTDRGLRRRYHPISITELDKLAQDALIELKLDDWDHLWSLRVAKGIRMWGIKLEDGRCMLVWIDPNHDVYPDPGYKA